MDEITLERRLRIKMFFKEYYFTVSPVISLFRLVGGPIIFAVGLFMYSTAYDRFGIAYGGIMIAFSVYYSFVPFWWILLKWKYYKTIHFKLEATPDKLIIKENQSESSTEYSKFESIIKRKTYFMLRIQKGLKIYLPLEKLSERTIEVLSENEKQ